MSRRALWVVVCAFALAMAGDADVSTTHTYLGNNPDEGNPGWHVEVQGLAHDADYWYITQNPSTPIPEFPLISEKNPRIWRVPVTHDLGDDVDCGQGGVSCGDLLDTPLAAHDYDHYGDPDIYEVGGQAYLLVPIENGDLVRASRSFELMRRWPFSRSRLFRTTTRLTRVGSRSIRPACW